MLSYFILFIVLRSIVIYVTFFNSMLTYSILIYFILIYQFHGGKQFTVALIGTVD
jgi:hypothetical protein